MMKNSIPQLPSQPRRRGSSFTVGLAAVLLVTGSMILLVLPTGFIGPVMVFGGMIFFGVIGFHYFVWGRWLSEILRQETEEREAGGVETETP